MAFHPTAFKRLFFSVLLVGVTLSLGHGQAVDSPVKFGNVSPITVTMVDPPSVGDSNTPRGEGSQWLKIDFIYSVTPLTAVPFVDSITFNIVLEGRDLFATDATSAEGVPVGLTGTLTYIHVAANRECHGVFYVHPATLARYATKSGVRDFTSRFNIHIDALIDGKQADYANLKKDPAGLDWYKAPTADHPAGLRPLTGLVYRQDQCCFIANDPSYYPELKHPAMP